MKRVLINISYSGKRFVGWQRQTNGLSVQEMIETALEKASGTFIRVTGASRTDSGVNALCQRAHFDTDSAIPPDRYPYVLNRYLPDDIRVTRGFSVAPCFHARFDAKEKLYTYRWYPGPHASALYSAISTHAPVPMDIDLMNRSAALLCGEHDFRAVAASGFQAKTTVRTITQAGVCRQRPFICLTIRGNGFLYNMVRIIAGTLVYIGQHKLDPACLSDALRNGDRLLLGPTAPPEGLELTWVGYSPELNLFPLSPDENGV